MPYRDNPELNLESVESAYIRERIDSEACTRLITAIEDINKKSLFNICIEIPRLLRPLKGKKSDAAWLIRQRILEDGLSKEDVAVISEESKLMNTKIANRNSKKGSVIEKDEYRNLFIPIKDITDRVDTEIVRLTVLVRNLPSQDSNEKKQIIRMISGRISEIDALEKFMPRASWMGSPYDPKSWGNLADVNPIALAKLNAELEKNQSEDSVNELIEQRIATKEETDWLSLQIDALDFEALKNDEDIVEGYEKTMLAQVVDKLNSFQETLEISKLKKELADKFEGLPWVQSAMISR